MTLKEFIRSYVKACERPRRKNTRDRYISVYNQCTTYKTRLCTFALGGSESELDPNLLNCSVRAWWLDHQDITVVLGPDNDTISWERLICPDA